MVGVVAALLATSFSLQCPLGVTNGLSGRQHSRQLHPDLRTLLAKHGTDESGQEETPRLDPARNAVSLQPRSR
jgi:hypothetical protein